MAVSILLVMLANCCLLSTAAPLGEHKSLRRAPEFLLKVNKCFRIRNEGYSGKAEDCIKFAGNEAEVENILASNTVWGFVGESSIQNSEARISFEMKTKTLNETIHNVDLQFYKDQLKEEDLKTRSTTNCNLEDGITLILKSIQSKNSVSFVTNITLSKKDLLKKGWIGFHGLKMWYIQSLEKSDANVTTATLQLSTLPKCAGISPEDLGIKSRPGYEPLMVVYSDVSEVESEENLYNLLKLKLIAKRSVHTTQLETNSSSGVGPDPTIRCQLISYNVSFSEFNIGLLSLDTMFEFNYCSGHCVVPIPDHQGVNHSKLAAALINRPTVTNKPSAPCCVPVKYQSLAVLVLDEDGSEGMYKIEPFMNMTATKCGCR